MRRLVLFDIDGTLLSADGAGARALRGALVEVFGTAGVVAGVSFAGKTDPQIVHELLRAEELSESRINRQLPTLWRSYLGKLGDELRQADIQVLPGIPELLSRMEAASDVVLLGLLTGNLRDGARLKLNAAGIGFHRFRVGAFGCDHAERAELPAFAVERAEARTRHRFTGKEIVIIGDTPNDVACGAHLGVRTIAVATGSYTTEQLAACNPDYVFPDLADSDAVWKAIFN